MRPLGITLEGFSAYRKRQVVDLEDVEFFSLSGPTGSGKSSLIDGMIFALYGRVPRLGARAVAPVITAGADRARVALDFEVRGQRYVVSRVAERTDTGAAVREARLERDDGTSIASGAGEVTRAVEDLLRLRFEDFTKTVVLPQGEFARFLNAGNRERRDLLRDLLGLDVYSKVRDLANERKAEATGRVGSARGQLASMDVPETADLETARERLAALSELSRGIGERLAALGEIEANMAEAARELSRLDDARRRLADIRPPPHLEEMDERLVAAREAEALAEEALAAKHEEAAALQRGIEELPGRETIVNTRARFQDLEELARRLDELDTAAARAAVDECAAALARAESELAEAERRAGEARLGHAAHSVSVTLVLGEPCPVCARPVDEIPDTEPPLELAEVDSEVAAAKEAVSARAEDLQTARGRSTELETRASELTTQRQALVARLADAPSLEELAAAEAELTRLETAVTELRSEIDDLETVLGKARKDHEAAAEAVRSVGRALMMAREEVADLRPPHSESDDPLVQWKDLLSWRDSAAAEIIAAKETLAAETERRRQSLEEERSGLVESLRSRGVPAEQPYDVAVAREVEVARSRVARLEEALERAAALEKQLEEASRTEAVAAALANHLRANGFERWLMAGAITGLVTGANELLSQLSGGGFSLQSDDEGSFRIIDHRNADEVREVATLSGGETFLVSLALSLSLAETLSRSGGAGLDAIILDEGFGTLDEESLDVVAAVLEELAGRGLMVGVITHVKELAARAPVRYQVTREPEGSRVEVMT